MTGPFLALFLLSVACWPTIFWYTSRVTDGSDEPWGLFALSTLVALTYLQRPQPVRRELALLVVSGLLIVYASGFWWAPQLVLAILAATAMAIIVSTQFLGKNFHVGTWSLAVLSLPLISSMQFYLGYPLRVAVATLSAALLQLSGFAVVPAGACLNWHGDLVAVDAPCSGIKMLWTSLYVASTLVTLNRLSAARSLTLLFVAALLALAGNVVRAASLFFIQSGIVDRIATMHPPEWVHEAVGLVSFACVVISLVLLAGRRALPRAACPPPPLVAPDTSSVLPELSMHAAAPIRTRFALPESIRRSAWQCARGSINLLNCRTAHLVYTAVAMIVAIVPLLPVKASRPVEMASFPGFPSHFHGQLLTPAALSTQEKNFATGFPGRIGKFTAGRKQIVFRWISKETRQLHPSSDCFKGSGYSVKSLPMFVDSDHRMWSTFEVTKANSHMRVSERIYDTAGNAWTDPSQWYWAAILNRTTGPWWAITIVEAIDASS